MVPLREIVKVLLHNVMINPSLEDYESTINIYSYIYSRMITKTIVCITMVAVVVVIYLAVYSPHGKVIEGFTSVGYCHEDPNDSGYLVAKTDDTAGWGPGDSCWTPSATKTPYDGEQCIGGGGLSDCQKGCRNAGINCGGFSSCELPKTLGIGIIGGTTNPCKEGGALASSKSCAITCKPGYNLSGGVLDTYSCANGKLTPGNIQCKPITCNIPKTFGAGIESGGASPCHPGSILNVNESCDVVCKKGYRAVSGATAFTCNTDATLKRASLLCNKVLAPVPTPTTAVVAPTTATTVAPTTAVLPVVAPLLPNKKGGKHIVNKGPAPIEDPAPQVTCICEAPKIYPGCPAHKNYTKNDQQYGLGHKSGHDRYHHDDYHTGETRRAGHQSSRRTPSTYDDYYRTTTFPKSTVKPYDSVMNLFY